MVFKRITHRLFSAGTSVLSGSNQTGKIRQLESMGFHPERARHALNATDNDVDRALEFLLLSTGDGASGGPTEGDLGSRENTNNNGGGNEGQQATMHNEMQMRRAIEESLRIGRSEEVRQIRQAEVASLIAPLASNPGAESESDPRSAEAMTAERDATSRRTKRIETNSLVDTHPKMKIPEKLQNKSKEEQVMRCAHRIKPHVMAVDTILRVLNSVRDSPDAIKFRTIDRTNPNYVTHVRDKPGAEDLLLAMNYRRDPIKNEMLLERHQMDDALLYLGISALEQMRESDEYIGAKKWRAFHADMRRVASQGGSHTSMKTRGMTTEETEVRLAFLSKCPKEPPQGRGALMHVYLGQESEKIEGGYISRRFDGDDILEDVLNWMGGCYGFELLDGIKSRDWCLCDLNRFPISPLDVEKHGNKTLQFLGLFPSGKLGVMLSEDAWKSGEEGDICHGSARGLGAASRSMLN